MHYIGIHKGYAVIPSLLLILVLVNNILIIPSHFQASQENHFTDAFMCALAIADLAMFVPITVTVMTFLHGSIIMNWHNLRYMGTENRGWCFQHSTTALRHLH